MNKINVSTKNSTQLNNKYDSIFDVTKKLPKTKKEWIAFILAGIISIFFAFYPLIVVFVCFEVKYTNDIERILNITSLYMSVILCWSSPITLCCNTILFEKWLNNMGNKRQSKKK